jgi:hypothetical protein
VPVRCVSYPFQVAGRFIRGKRFTVFPDKKIGLVAGKESEICFSDNIFFGSAKKLFKTVVASKIGSVYVFQPNRVRNGFNKRF